MIKISLKGRVISKKNSRQNRKAKTAAGKVYGFTVPSEAFDCFKNDCIQQITQARIPKLLPPYFITYDFFLKGGLDIDIDNAQTSINDILQDKLIKIIDNDKNIIAVQARKHRGQDDWRVELTIEEKYIFSS